MLVPAQGDRAGPAWTLCADSPEGDLPRDARAKRRAFRGRRHGRTSVDLPRKGDRKLRTMAISGTARRYRRCSASSQMRSQPLTIRHWRFSRETNGKQPMR